MVTLNDGTPVVKIIDFGVAELTAQELTEKALFTSYGQMIGTPAYMSPERASMSLVDVDTRSDIYAAPACYCTSSLRVRRRSKQRGYGKPAMPKYNG